MSFPEDEQKVFVIGIDGAPYTLMKEYAEAGILPSIGSILSRGFTLNQMDASIPDVSSTSWTSFMTGVNPGEHGIYGFMELKEGGYKLSFPSFDNVLAPAVWEILGNTAGGKTSTLFERRGGAINRAVRSIVLNVPQTFPARPMNGVLTAGFVCPDFKKGTYPESAYGYLSSIGYMPDIDAAKAADKPEEFFDDAFLALEKRVEAFEHYLDGPEWGLFIGVITETDRIHHFFFDAARDPSHRYHERFVSFYRKMDSAIGRLFERFMSKTNGKGFFMTMSDHGFVPIKKEVYVNAWLRENGLLSLNTRNDYYEQVEGGSRAFAMDPARIYINTEKRYPSGSVKESDREKIAAEIKSGLEAMTDIDGSPVIKRVYENRELYSGLAARKGPDLVCVANDGYDLKGNLKKNEVFGRSRFMGMHTRHDAHCILPSGANPSQRLHIERLADLILDNFSGL
ncbi:MAG: alkaline phosphatase family protein [Deltaproteobacteria bacterium]|nr:alkaline phosphatase family protein [Deltaproteobacteria bacterium]